MDIIPIVTIKNNAVITNSRDVATYFGKEHFNVLQDIDKLIRQGVLDFQETPYVHEQNGQTYRMFEMTRDGFTLLAELTGKRHDHVMRDITAMLTELHGVGGLPKFGDTYRNEQNGQLYPCFNLPPLLTPQQPPNRAPRSTRCGEDCPRSGHLKRDLK